MKVKILLLSGLMAAGFLLKSCEGDPLGIFSDDPRDGITGNWKVNEDSQLFKKSTARYYDVNIKKDNSDSTRLYVNNFYELGKDVSIILDGRTINIPGQTIDGYTINGHGLVSSDFETIDWSYTVNLNTGDEDGVTATYSRPSR